MIYFVSSILFLYTNVRFHVERLDVGTKVWQRHISSNIQVRAVLHFILANSYLMKNK